MTKDGAESQLLKTLDRLPPEQYEATVVLSRAEGERVKELTALPCVREVATLAGEGKRMRLLEKAFALGGIVNAAEPDIVHSWLWYSNFSADSPVNLGCGDRFRSSLHNGATTMRDTESFGSGLQKNSSTIPPMSF